MYDMCLSICVAFVCVNVCNVCVEYAGCIYVCDVFCMCAYMWIV